ncbi:MAG: HEAT repeat domain-containing protein [Bacteroidales bacterium]
MIIARNNFFLFLVTVILVAGGGSFSQSVAKVYVPFQDDEITISSAINNITIPAFQKASSTETNIFFAFSSGKYFKLATSQSHSENNAEIKNNIWQRARSIYLDAPLKVKSLLIILAYLLVSLIVLFVAILINRQLKTKKRRKIKELKQEYQEQLADFLFNDEVESIEFKGIDSKMNRQIFIDELRFLHSNLYGEAASKLRDLYFNLDLHKDSLRKVYRKRWFLKLKGFKEVAQLDVKDANDYISEFVNHKNPIIRVEAQVALVKLSDENPLGFLENLKYTLSDWEMINIYDTLIYHQINIESFEPWLENQNYSVVVFALRMIMLFKHVDAMPKVKQLLFHEHPEIRLAAVKALKPMESEEYISDLIQLFRDETYRLSEIIKQHKENEKNKKLPRKDVRSLDDLLPRKIRYEIIDALQTVVSEKELTFLSYVAKDPDNSFAIRMLSLRTIYSVQPQGNDALNRLMEEEDATLNTIITNVKQTS